MERAAIVVVVDDPDDDGARADVVLGRRTSGLSRRVARQLALAGHLRIDGRPAPPSARVHLGARLELHAARTDDPLPTFDLLLATDDYVFVAKPGGVHTHRLRPSDPPALADAVAARFPDCSTASDDPREQGVLHRLDVETTGVVAFARHPAAWRTGRAAITSEAHKIYLAITDLSPRRHPALRPIDEPCPVLAADVQGFELTAPLGRGPGRGVAIRADGRPAITRLWCIAEHDDWGAVALRLLTGRRHQARAHLAHLGAPIRGDARYGSRESGPLLLHAARLELLPGRLPAVDAPLPPSFRALLGGRGIVGPR